MAISLSVVLLLAIILVVMIRSNNIKAGPAIVAILFGFFLASTGMAPSIQRFLNSIAETINTIKF
ncbi:flagellar biosynthesis protein FliQ [Streptomyces olivoverticillatus]|uniref:Flagellar biosynthesis protein FliQ n=1 Tax=Streptomyces olivoverticillatus TaxID=66427 RepID=A0A7W7PJS1_9ACTN|nr:flagellar biosynthesis protein FliQ [Streptomyces olivoverticillatus]